MIWHEKIYYALSSCILLCETLEELGITYSFGTFAKEPVLRKRWKDKWRKIHIEDIYTKFGGGTQDYKALQLAERSWSGKHKKKVILVITDGASESKTQLQKTLHQIKNKVIAIGINLQHEQLRLYPNKILTKINNLPQCLSSILKKELL